MTSVCTTSWSRNIAACRRRARSSSGSRTSQHGFRRRSRPTQYGAPARVTGTSPFSSFTVRNTPLWNSAARVPSTPSVRTMRSMSPYSHRAARRRGAYGLLGAWKTARRRSMRKALARCSRRASSAARASAGVSGRRRRLTTPASIAVPRTPSRRRRLMTGAPPARRRRAGAAPCPLEAWGMTAARSTEASSASRPAPSRGRVSRLPDLREPPLHRICRIGEVGRRGLVEILASVARSCHRISEAGH